MCTWVSSLSDKQVEKKDGGWERLLLLRQAFMQAERPMYACVSTKQKQLCTNVNITHTCNGATRFSSRGKDCSLCSLLIGILDTGAQFTWRRSSCHFDSRAQFCPPKSDASLETDKQKETGIVQLFFVRYEGENVLLPRVFSFFTELPGWRKGELFVAWACLYVCVCVFFYLGGARYYQGESAGPSVRADQQASKQCQARKLDCWPYSLETIWHWAQSGKVHSPPPLPSAWENMESCICRKKR